MIRSYSTIYGDAKAFVQIPSSVWVISRLVRSCSETHGVINVSWDGLGYELVDTVESSISLLAL